MLYKFKELAASNMSIGKRKPVYGVGINDAWYMINVNIGGKLVTCKFYTKWVSMLTRCYSSKFHEMQPTYTECMVCKEWLTFSNFKKWMETQEWGGVRIR